MQRGEGIVGDLRLGGGDGGEEGRLAGIGQADEAGIGDQLQPQPDPASPRPARPGLARRGARLVEVLKWALPKPPLPPLREHDALADLGQVGDQRLVVLVEDLRADRHLQDRRRRPWRRSGCGPCRAAGLGLEMLLVAVVDQRVETVDRFDHDVAAASAVAAVRAAELDEFLAPERDAARRRRRRSGRRSWPDREISSASVTSALCFARVSAARLRPGCAPQLLSAAQMPRSSRKRSTGTDEPSARMRQSADAGPLEAALLQHAARRRIGDARATACSASCSRSPNA